MTDSASGVNVRVVDGELRVDSPFRSWIIRGWPELTARTKARYPWRVVCVSAPRGARPEAVVGEELLHRLGDCEVQAIKLVRGSRWERARPEIDLARALLLPLGCCVHEQARRWRRLASSPGPFPETPADACEPEWRSRRHDEKRIIADYFANVPEAVRKAIEPFWFGQWPLLLLAQRCPGGLKLIQRNPALAFCLATLSNSQDRPPFGSVQTKRRLLRRPDSEICAAMGFEKPEVAALLLSRTPPEACFDSGLSGLRRLTRHGWREDLAELPALNEDLLCLITLPAILRVCRLSLLLELARKPPATTPSYAGLIWGIVRMLDRRFGTAAGDAVRLSSMRYVARCHAWLARQERRPDTGME